MLRGRSPGDAEDDASEDELAYNVNPKRRMFELDFSDDVDAPPATVERHISPNRRKASRPQRRGGDPNVPMMTSLVDKRASSPGDSLLPASFSLHVEANALALADLHGRLCAGPVTGFLSGVWDATTRRTHIFWSSTTSDMLTELCVLRAYPCYISSSENDDAPVADNATLQSVAASRQVIVGWYFSYSSSSPLRLGPRDLSRHLNYDSLYSDKESAPFVALCLCARSFNLL